MNEIYEIYKIRRKSDGLFSKGGVTPRFNKKGKSWKLGGLKNHFNLIQEYNNNHQKRYENSVNFENIKIKKPFGYHVLIEIVKFEVSIKELGLYKGIKHGGSYRGC